LTIWKFYKKYKVVEYTIRYAIIQECSIAALILRERLGKKIKKLDIKNLFKVKMFLI